MSSDPCVVVSFDRFIEYWFGELSPDEQDALEGHVFECADCAPRTEAWARQMAALTPIAKELPRSALLPSEVAELGGSVEVVDVPSEGRVTVTLRRERPIHVFRVPVDRDALAAVDRLDVEYVRPETAEPIFYVSDAPIEPASGEVVVACHHHVLRAHGDTIMRLVGTTSGERRTLFEATIHFV